MGNFEQQLKELAQGGAWEMRAIDGIIDAIDKQQEKLETAIGLLPARWKGQAGAVHLARMRVHARNLSTLRAHVSKMQMQVSGRGNGQCYANCDSTDRALHAQEALDSLPPTLIPTSVLDQARQGANEVLANGVGTVSIEKLGAGWTSFVVDVLSGHREQAAKEAVERIDKMISGRAKQINFNGVEFDPLPTYEGTFQPVPPPEMAPVPSGNFGGPGGGGSGLGSFPGGGGGAGYPGYPGGPGGPGGGGTEWTPPGGTTNPGGTGNPGGDGSGGGNGDGSGGGNDGSGTRPVYPGGDGTTPTRPGGPSVDSGLEGGRPGFGVGAGLGAAGLGAVGLAAGAKIAGGAGGAGFGAGGFGVGVGGAGAAGAGTAGMAGTTGTGAAGAGSGNSGSSAAKGAGAGRPGMMMGGQGGGAADKKGGTNRLGYVAPKFEDEYEENMPHPASRAGKRGE